jgi:hypothetical protein
VWLNLWPCLSVGIASMRVRPMTKSVLVSFIFSIRQFTEMTRGTMSKKTRVLIPLIYII